MTIHLHPTLRADAVKELEARTGMRAKIVNGKVILVEKKNILTLLRIRHGKG